ncbi:MFS transporter [Lentibacillus sediminis]|uniref:MFS transporter n=1 Tax=Lentibacillus sediminis TaxID=1940529 RepID=UPI000C1BE2EC|nr:MFS transporter [Lentibacillus sediminis]
MKLLSNSAFLMLFAGRILTNMADSIYYIAAMWIVYDLTGNAFYTGLAGFLTSLPWALQFFTGPLVDKWATKSVLVWTQFIQGILLAVIPLLAMLDWLTVTAVLILLPIISMTQQFVYPAQTKALPQIVKKDELVTANSYFSFAYQGIDFILNAAAGVFVALIGVIALFAVDSLLFIIAAMLFMMLRLPKRAQKKAEKNRLAESLKQYRKDLQSGFHYVFRSVLGLFTLGAIITNFAIGGIMALLPAFADLQGGAALYGYYLAVMSVGGLLGALLAPRVRGIRMGAFYITAFSLAAMCWAVSATTTSPMVSLIFFGLVWVPVGVSNVIVPTAIQTAVPGTFLGRVNSVSVSVSNVSMPLGSLIGGYMGMVLDIRIAFLLFGLVLALEVVIWLSHPTLRGLPKMEELSAESLRLPGFDERGS